MQRDAPDVGVLGIVLGAVRAHRVETGLCVLASLAWLLGLIWADERPIGMRIYNHESVGADVDARLASVLLEIRDGTWVVREGDTVVEPTLGRKGVEIRHEAAGGHLYPWAYQTKLWTAGSPLLRRRVTDWSVVTQYRIVRRRGVPAIGIDDSMVHSGVRGSPSFHGYAVLGSPMIASGFNPLGRSMGFVVADGSLLHLAALLPEDAGDPDDVATWRALVVTDTARLARDIPAERSAVRRITWWRENELAVVTVAALAAVLRTDEAIAPLMVLRDDLDRDLTPATPGSWFRPENSRAALSAAIDVLTGDEADIDVEALTGHFASADGARVWLRADDAAPTGERLPGVPVWAAPSAPDRVPPYVPIGLLALIAAAAYGGGDRLRHRDVAAFALAAVTASTFLEILPHVTLQSPGLMALAIVVARLRDRGALGVAPGVVHGLAAAALLLPLAGVTRLPPLDALGRAAAFVALAWLALAALDPRAQTDDAPRRVPSKRDVGWTALQLLAVTGCVLALLLALLDPTSWATRTPQPRWILIGGGLVLSLAAGVVAFLRRREVRPQPAVVCAVAIAAPAHLLFVGLSPFPRDWLSGENDLGRIGMLAAAIVVVFAIGRLHLVARAHRAAS